MKRWMGIGLLRVIRGQELCRRDIGQMKCLCHALERTFAMIAVQAGKKSGICLTSSFYAMGGQLKPIWDRGIHQSLSCGSGNCPGHIGDAVMDNSIYLEDGVVMGGGMGCFKAASLVHSDINNHGPWLHKG